MESIDRVRVTRRDMLRLTAGGAGMFMLTASGLAVSSGVSAGGGGLYVEAFPTSPLILSPFNEPLPIPKAMAPVPKANVDGWESPPGPDNQDFVTGAPAHTHQLWPGAAPVTDYPLPLVYRIKLEVAGHDFTSSSVQPIDSIGGDTVPPGTGNTRPRKLASSTIYGYNGTFPGPMINFEYRKPALGRLENHLEHAHRPPRRRVRWQPGSGVRALQPAGTARPRGGLRARRVGRQPVPRVSGRRRRPRDPVVLLVPRPRPRPHGGGRVQGHGRSHAAVRPEDRQRRRDRHERPAAAGCAHAEPGRLVRRRIRHPTRAV